MNKIIIILLLIQPVLAQRHLSEYSIECRPENFRQTIVLFTDSNSYGYLRKMFNEVSDVFRGMNYKPVVMYETCNVEIKLVPSFMQFGKDGKIVRILDPLHPTRPITNSMDILTYFMESMTSSRTNIAVSIDMSGRNPLMHNSNLDNHDEIILAVLPRKGYNERLAEYVEWAQEQEYGVFEFQYTQEHLDDKTSMLLGSIGHLQSHFTSSTITKPIFYHLHRVGKKTQSQSYDSLRQLNDKIGCVPLCVDNRCGLRKRNPYTCDVKIEGRKCYLDKDCS